MTDKELETMTTEELRAEVLRQVMSLTEEQVCEVLRWVNAGMPDPNEWIIEMSPRVTATPTRTEHLKTIAEPLVI